jgi:hypothetical protein
VEEIDDESDEMSKKIEKAWEDYIWDGFEEGVWGDQEVDYNPAHVNEYVGSFGSFN